MEGIVFELRWTMENVREAGLESRELRMVGGAAASPVWPRIVADITHLPVAIPSTTEAASCGAAILAGAGSGVFVSPEAGYRSMMGGERLLEPDENAGRRYDELYQIYGLASQQLQSPLAKLSGFETGEGR
jgi:sugar (pentulose or hexulose) kinase